jgi:hypothetical protein
MPRPKMPANAPSAQSADCLDAAGSRPPHRGEELGTEPWPVGDDAEKGGENIWISRIGIDLGSVVAHSVSSSETRARRTSSEHRKVGAREARSEAARWNGGKPRERCKAESREGNEPRKGSVTGVGRRIRLKMVRGASRRLPWSRRDRLGRGLSDTTPARCQRPIADVAPRSAGGFGRTVTRGCVASGPGLFALFPRGRDSAPAKIRGNLRSLHGGEGLSARWPRARRPAHQPPPGGSARPGPGPGRRDG